MQLVKTAIEQFDWSNRKLLVACSGGLDSVVLVHVLHNQKIPFVLLHINYQLRGEDSEKDEQFVQELAENLSIPFRAIKCPTELTQGKGINLQNAAREFRRTLFDQWKELGEEYFVVLAHHLDDQIETFFLQFYRGSGMIGLSGMKVERDKTIRPFLDLHKEDLKEFAVANNIQWREDQSNASNKYLRNLFRNTLIPAVKTQIPELESAIRTLQTAFTDSIQQEEESIREILQQIITEELILTNSWNSFTETQKTLLIRKLNVPHWALERIEQLFESELSATIETDELIFLKTHNGLLFQKRNENVKNWDFKIEAVQQLPDSFNNSVLYCSSQIAENKPELRYARKEDKIFIPGINGRKLVWEILKENGVPAQLRSKQLVLSTNEEIIWVPGFAVSKNALVKKGDSSTIKITVVEKNQQSEH